MATSGPTTEVISRIKLASYLHVSYIVHDTHDYKLDDSTV